MWKYIFVGLLLFQIPVIHADDKISFVLLIRERYPYKYDLLSLYENYITEMDYIVIFPGIKSIDYTKGLEGYKVATYFSIDEMNNYINILKDKVLYIAYNIEHNLSPTNEVNDIVNSVKMASELAHKNGLKLMVAPSGRLTEIYAKELVRFTDVYILQYQALQSNPDDYEKYVKNIVTEIRKVDNNVKLVAQVSTLRGDVKSMIDSFNRVKAVVDGVTIFYGLEHEEIDKLRIFLDFIKRFREYEGSLNDIVLTDVKKSIKYNKLELNSLAINTLDIETKFTYIVKVKDKEEVIDLKFYEYTLKPYESKQLTHLIDNGEYDLEIFIWSDLERPIPLAIKYILY
ncbi:MAG: hypothetical protein KatS3mg003_1757 [Candidatus Nitrosocaldaceae archaeon]|nr:MAG: hypothetical protein KatS3mg003_1757 [Candidatus Nitrosocaldaceae archaeon]